MRKFAKEPLNKDHIFYTRNDTRFAIFSLKILISTPAINHPFNETMLVFADFFTVNAHHTLTGQGFSPTLAMDFSNLWKPCCRFTHACFHWVSSYGAYRCQQWLSRWITCQRAKCLHSTVTSGKTPATVTWSEPLKIFAVFCYAIRPTVEQSARKFRNLPLQAKEQTWVNCKIITAWHQNSEPGSCAVWVSYRQINSHCKNYID